MCNASQLAARVGRDKSAICRWKEKAGWAWGDGPWTEEEVAAIEQWAAQTVAESHRKTKGQMARGEFTSADERASRIAVATERAKKLQLERRIKAKEFVLRATVEARDVQKVHIVRQALLGAWPRFESLIDRNPRASWGAIWEQVMGECCEAFAANDIDDEPTEEGRQDDEREQAGGLTA